MTEVDARVVRLLHDARHALEEERRRRSEPIAIVGIGCRFPGGASSPERYWEMLRDGVDTTRDVPSDRWDADALYHDDPDVPGKAYVKRGAFLESIKGFEPEFFGISPREAMGLDPQQRLLLEVSWEALEDAGIAPHGLNGSATGVWIGQSLDDYARRAGYANNLERIDPHSALGNARSVTAGRIAYVLGLHGPVMQVDTSCSSSLVALHLACQSLRAGECDLALVGGVNLIASPETTIALCKLRALSRDGRCKTFDARADGYGRGEGCGVVVLERVSDAIAASDRAYAEIRGSALNHDGRSNGLTAPNGAAQEAVLRRALANAGLGPREVQYIEAHGTGTLLGDPIELLALNRVFGAGRSSVDPLYVGSVKTNIGHLEAAAGIAALIKTALSISHGHIPPHLHLLEPNPKIPWRDLPFQVPLEARPWPSGASRVAGVSSFGMSGTNAHVLLAPAVEASPAVTQPRSAAVIVLSARTDEALRESAGRLREHLSSRPELGLDEVAATLAMGRSALKRRVAMVHSSRGELDAALATLAGGEQVSIGEGQRGRAVAWLFPGQGAQSCGMGRALSREFPSFRHLLEQAFAAVDAHLKRPIASVMWAEPGTSEAALLQQTEYCQPALFALGWALAGLWRSWGITPGWVAGHSIGELTAACVAGVWSLADAARLVCARGRLMQALPHDGAMLAIGLDVDDAERLIEPHRERVAIAAINAPASVVLSGDRLVLQLVAERLSQQGIAHKALAVSHAFHSPLIEPMLDAFSSVANSIEYHPARIPIVSNVSGALAGSELLTGKYWVHHVREPVKFASGVRALHGAGARTFFELGAKTVLLPLVEQTLAGEELLLLPSGRSGKPETAALLDAVGVWWKEGGTVSWREVFAPNVRRCALPTYPWQRKSYWQEAGGPRSEQAVTLLGTKVASATGDVLFESTWSAAKPAWVADHRLGDQVVVPGAAIAELARAAAASLYGPAGHVRSLSLEKAIVLGDDEALRVQVLASQGGHQLGIYSRAFDEASGPWTLHATAELSTEKLVAAIDAVAEPAGVEERSASQFYAELAAIGLNYGASFRIVERIWCGADEAVGELRLSEGVEISGHELHPCLLDAAFQLAAAIADEPLECAFLPVEVRGFTLWRRAPASVRAHVRRAAPRDGDTVRVSVTVADSKGVVASIDQVVFRRVPLEAVTRGGLLYELRWRGVQAPPLAPPSGSWTLVETPSGARLDGLAGVLRERGATCRLSSAAALRADFSAGQVVCFWDRDGSVDTALGVASEALEIAQNVISDGRRPRVWWVTRGAVSILPHEVPQPGLAAIWGLGRTLMVEHPELGCTLIDVDDAAHLADVLVSESTASDHENQVAWRGPERYVARLKQAERQPRGTPRVLRNDGTVLITGGLGALGIEVAHSLAQRGVKQIILASRRGLQSADLAERFEGLQRLGTRISVAELDVRKLDQVRTVIDSIPRDAPLRGVIHAAGLVDDGVWSEQNPSRLESVMAPKVMGAWNLHRLTRDADLDLFVLFSSIAGTLGSAGQAGYAAANACLDALAEHRRALGLPAQSLAFGPWEEGLAAKLSAQQRDRLIRQGIGFLSSARGRDAFERAVARPETALVVADLRPAVIARSFAHAVPGLWSDLLPRPGGDSGGTRQWRVELVELASDAERLERLNYLIAKEAGAILSISPAESIPRQQALGDLGLDSLMALELRRGLSRRSGISPSGLLITSRSTVASLAASLLDAMRRGSNEAQLPQVVAAGRCVSALSRPKARLFCFHYAGGSAEMFEPFDELATLGIEVHTVSHTRAKPVSAEVARQYLAEASAYIAERSDAPYAIFGHSLGGLIARRVLEELLDQRVAPPQLFVPSAAAFPEGLAGDFSPDALGRAYRLIVGARDEASDSLLAEFIADTLIWRALPPKVPVIPLPVPIAAFVGSADHIASEPAMRAWAQRTSSRFSFTAVDGDHFYLSEAAPRRMMLAELARQILDANESSATR